MLTFTPIDEKNAEQVGKYYSSCPYRLSDYSLGLKLMWRYMLGSEYTVSHGCLVVRSKIRGRYAFDYPFAVEENADIDGALADMAAFCSENFLPFEFSAVPREFVHVILERYPNVETRVFRNYNDYLYAASDFIAFSGKRYAGQRNHVKKFRTKYPGAVFRELTVEDAPLIHAFRERFMEEFHKNSYGAKNELERAWHMLRFVGTPLFRCGGFMLNGELISFCLAEKCGDTLVDHIEKALPDYEGIYPAMVQEFARIFASDVQYINREDDAGDRGLRTSKMQYQPIEILEKYSVKVKNELYHVEKIPVLETERLTLDAITEEDIPAYNRLCLDDERNRYWGYDYRIDCENPDDEYFYLDQKKDFGSSTAMNFAIRLDGTFIGEIILYHFDFRGGAEAGVRILPEFEGHGYAKEAYAAACEYALYGIGMHEIRGKCCKENLRSKNMLALVMHPAGEDDTYYYFRRTV